MSQWGIIQSAASASERLKLRERFKSENQQLIDKKMKKLVIIILGLLAAVNASAQSTNPLNYSGKLYVSSIDVLSTPRYISYEEHAIISQDMSIPVVEVTKIVFDFENGIINMNDKDHKVKVTSVKKYETDMGWQVVLYIDFLDETDKYELVWKEYGKPFLQEITKEEDGVKIARMNLSTKPSATSPDEAIMQLLGGYGGF